MQNPWREYLDGIVYFTLGLLLPHTVPLASEKERAVQSIMMNYLTKNIKIYSKQTSLFVRWRYKTPFVFFRSRGLSPIWY